MEYDTQKTEALVLSEKEIGETDKIFVLYSKEFGRIEVLGKSIRKTKAKLRGGLQPLNYISLEFIQGKNFLIATEAILKDGFSNIKPDYKKYRIALYICILLGKFTKEEKDNNIWELIKRSLKDIDELDDANGRFSLLLRFFEWNLISFLGFKPELYSCVFCEEKIRIGKFFFSLRDGGIVCEKCFRELEESETRSPPFSIKKEESGSPQSTQVLKKISRDTIKILRLIITQNREIILRLRINPRQEEELKDISKIYIEYILEEEVFLPQ